MPYITEEERRLLHNGAAPFNAGQLNYVISHHIDNFLWEKGINYEGINTVLGVLEACKQEIYRRIAAPYEDKKQAGNGEVFSVLQR